MALPNQKVCGFSELEAERAFRYSRQATASKEEALYFYCSEGNFLMTTRNNNKSPRHLFMLPFRVLPSE
jgi:hypothetical protein